MEIVGHVSRQMLSWYAHIRTKAKRKALEEVERRRAAELERNQRASRGGVEAAQAANPMLPH